MIKYQRDEQNNLFVPLVFYIKNPDSNGRRAVGRKIRYYFK